MDTTVTKPPKTMNFYNVFLCLLGIHTKLLDFHGISTKETTTDKKPLKKSLLKLASAIIFISFVLHYPILISEIISHIPIKKSKKNVEYFVYYAHSYSKYVIIIVIYILELLTEKSIQRYQKKIERILLRLDHIYAYWAQNSNKKLFKSKSLYDTLIKMSILNNKQFIKIILFICCCTLFNTSKYVFIFNGCVDEHIYDFFFNNLPYIFISTFVLHSSFIIVQYTKLFCLLNEIIKVIASDISKRVSGNTKQLYRMDKSIGKQFNETTDSRQLQTSISNIAILIETHDDLRANIVKLQKFHSIQWNSIVLYSFLNIIFEVRNVISNV